MKTRLAVAAALIAFLGGLAGYAQLTEIKARIDFPFKVDGKVLPAGTYDFVRDDYGTTIRVTDENKTGAIAEVLTRLSSQIHTTPGDAHIVFDKIGDTFVLSEVWIPGSDGYVLAVSKEKHEHRTVNVKY